MKHVDVVADDGFALTAQVAGPESGPALLLLAGQANAHLWWSRTRSAFEGRFRTVTFDYRGTGGSRGPVGEWTTSSFATDAAAVLAAVGVEQCGVYGTSMGGRVAQMLAAEHPQVVHRLVLACTSPGGPHARERSEDVRRRLVDRDRDRRLAALQDLFFTPSWRYPPRESTLFGDPTMTPAESRAHLRASSRHDAWDLLPRITAPTLVLHGTADLMVPVENAPALASRIPRAEMVLHEGGRHGFFEEFAHDVTPRVLTFLGS